MGSLSRRSFLLGAGVAGAGMIGGGLAACAPASPSANAAHAPEGLAESGNGEPAFLQIAPIDEAAITETIDADVVVIGMGLAGTAAFRAAAEEGLTVVGVEKTEGVCGRSSDFAYFNTEKAREIGIKDVDVPELVNELMREMNHRADARILTTWARHAGEALDWYVEPYEGFMFVSGWDTAPTDEAQVFGINGDYYVGGTPPYDMYDPKRDHERTYSATLEFNPDGHLPVLQANYETAVKSGNATAYFGCAGRQLMVENGRVIGAIIEDMKEGTYRKVHASKGVILATGGYSFNDDMIGHYLPWMAGELSAYKRAHAHLDVKGNPVDQGEGIVMGHGAGAKIEGGPHCALAHSILGSLGVNAHLQLNAEGERYINEDLTIDHFSVAVMNQPKNTIYQIFDATYADTAARAQSGIGTFHQVPEKTIESIDEWTAAKGETVEELVANLGVSDEVASKMVASIARYNELCEKGVDEDFGKCPDRLFPVSTPPFYAVRFSPEEAAEGRAALRMLTTMSGLVTDPNANCLDENDDPIPGLYAVGNVQGGRFVISYPCTVAGASHSMALTYGYLTGKHMAEL